MPTFANGYAYRKQITIPHAKVVGGVDLINYPATISVTDVLLRTVANGGRVQHASGFDLRFETLTGTKLDHDIELWSATTGRLSASVRLPTLSASVDTSFYLYYGKSGLLASEENKTGVWNANYLGVYHLNEASGGTTLADSTINARTATIKSGTLLGGAVGKFGTAVQSGGPGYTLATDPWPVGAAARTFQAWAYLSAASLAGGPRMLFGCGNAATGQAWEMGVYTGKWMVHWYGTGYITSDYVNAAVTGDKWSKVDISYTAAGARIFVDGVFIGLATPPAPINTGAAGTSLFDSAVFFTTNEWPDPVDELRVLNVQLSDGWIATEYANQNDPATFHLFGAEDAAAPVTAFLVVAGITVPVAPSGASERQSETIGDPDSRNAEGVLNVSVRAEKRVWSMITKGLTPVAAEALRAACLVGIVPCSGLALGDGLTTFTCRVTIADGPYTKVRGGHRRVLSLLLRQS